jgi:hypothetical protein
VAPATRAFFEMQHMYLSLGNKPKEKLFPIDNFNDFCDECLGFKMKKY